MSTSSGISGRGRSAPFLAAPGSAAEDMNRWTSRTRAVTTRAVIGLLGVYFILALATSSPFRALALEAVGLLALWVAYVAKFTLDDPRALEPEVLWFRGKDRLNRPGRDVIVFTGSSTIAHWSSLQEDMAPLRVLNRGINGARIHQIAYYVDQIIIPYRPRAVVLYAGENDISGVLWSAKKTPDEVRSAFRAFCEKIHARLPDVPIYFISIKPPKRRGSSATSFQAANRLVKELCASDGRLHFIDVVPALLGADGQPRGFGWDGIHLNDEGYRILTSVVRPCLATAYLDVDL
jgi:lysophospholipase L1-like esterase